MKSSPGGDSHVKIAFLYALLVLASASFAEASDRLGPPIGVELARFTESGSFEFSSRDQILLQREVGGKARSNAIDGGEYAIRFDVGAQQVALDSGREVLNIAAPFRFRVRDNGRFEWSDRDYEGWVEVIPRREGGWAVVNRLPMERYLLGVLGSEMPARFHLEALKAQAIAARTYALFHILENEPIARVHVMSGTSSQVYRGIPSRMMNEKIYKAIEATTGQVVMYESKARDGRIERRIFETLFHSTCGGSTARCADVFQQSGPPTLSGVNKCENCRASKRFRWEINIAASELKEILERYPLIRSSGLTLGEIEEVKVVSDDGRGRAEYVRIVHSQGSFELLATELRSAVNAAQRDLYSTRFQCEKRAGVFIFSGGGWGHGVGLCQFGADGLARQGSDGVQILNFYYPQSSVWSLW